MRTVFRLLTSIVIVYSFSRSPSKLVVNGDYTFTGRPDEYIKMKCPPKQALYSMGGVYYQENHDRQYTFKCKVISSKEHTDCSSTDDWNNALHRTLDFSCPDDKFITGIESQHLGDRFEDRFWKLTCCRNTEIKLSHCKKTSDFVNDITHQFEFKEPFRIFKGLESIFQHISPFKAPYEYGYNDRRWKIETCDYARAGSFSCDLPGEALSAIHGKYHEDISDRSWTYTCRKVSGAHASCYWTIEYLNAFNQNLNFGCRTNHYFAGIYSYSSEYAKDRRYKIRCCSAADINIIKETCQSSDYINEFRQEISNELKDGSLYIGMESYHGNAHGQQDRRWKFETCKYELETIGIVCPDKQGIFVIDSTYNEPKLDRWWVWHCKEVSKGPFTDCYWTEYLNEADGHLKGNCHGNYVLAGLRSYQDAFSRDRIWKIRCCTSDRLLLDFCKKGDEANNDYRQKMYYTTNGVVTGLESDHNAKMKDRLWKVNTCQYLKRDYSIKCPEGHGVYLMQSTYYKKEFDRTWDFKCIRVADTFNDDCYWIGKEEFINKPDFDVNAKCDRDYVINEIKSSFSDYHRDRQWNVRCCRNKKAILTQCETTPKPINQLQQNFMFEVNFKYVLTGLESKHDGFSEDRRWKVSYCKFQCCQ